MLELLDGPNYVITVLLPALKINFAYDNCLYVYTLKTDWLF